MRYNIHMVFMLCAVAVHQISVYAGPPKANDETVFLRYAFLRCAVSIRCLSLAFSYQRDAFQHRHRCTYTRFHVAVSTSIYNAGMFSLYSVVTVAMLRLYGLLPTCPMCCS